MRGRDVGIVEALDDDSPLLGLTDVALVITESCGMDVNVFVAVGLIVWGAEVSVLLFKLLAVLDAVTAVGLAELSGTVASVAELALLIVFDGPVEVIPEVGLEGSALVSPVVGPVV